MMRSHFPSGLRNNDEFKRLHPISQLKPPLTLVACKLLPHINRKWIGNLRVEQELRSDRHLFNRDQDATCNDSLQDIQLNWIWHFDFAIAITILLIHTWGGLRRADLRYPIPNRRIGAVRRVFYQLSLTLSCPSRVISLSSYQKSFNIHVSAGLGRSMWVLRRP